MGVVHAEESAESNSSSSALKSEGRKFDRFALFRMICNLFTSSALINPCQEGLAYVICARKVARATSHSAGPLRPWLLSVIEGYAKGSDLVNSG